MNKQNKDSQLVVRIERNLKDEYKTLCEELGYTFSKRIISILKRDMELLKKKET